MARIHTKQIYFCQFVGVMILTSRFYCRSIELQVALVDNDLFCPETWLSFTISPFKVALAILKESEILNKDIVLSLISWDKLEENDGKTDEI
jgi:hypothetical protein